MMKTTTKEVEEIVGNTFMIVIIHCTFTIRVVRSNYPIACSVSNGTSFAVASRSQTGPKLFA